MALRRDTLRSRFLGVDRDVTVYLPPEYDEAAADGYPLLVLHDGQNLFDPERSHVPGQTWHVAETAEALIASGRITPLVIAGVDHGGEARIDEYAPTAVRHRSTGRGDTHTRFLVEEVLPFLRSACAIRPGFANTGLGGSSLGALATLAAAIGAPGQFGRLLVMSPSVWWDRRVILRRLESQPLTDRPRVWLDVGRKEGPKTVRDARSLRDALQSDVDLCYVEDPAGDHSETSWARRLPDALAFLYDTR